MMFTLQGGHHCIFVVIAVRLKRGQASLKTTPNTLSDQGRLQAALVGPARIRQNTRMNMFRLNPYILISVLLLTVAFGKASYEFMQPEPGQINFEVRGHTAHIRGYTNNRTFAAITNLKREHPQVRHLELHFMSGTLDSMSNLKLARQIRAAGYTTHLPKGSHIASGAVDLFLAGVERTMECGALIGVHAWGDSLGRTAQDPGADVFESVHRTFLSDMGITPDFYNFTRAAARHDDIHWMRPTEIRDYDLLTRYPKCD